MVLKWKRLHPHALEPTKAYEGDAGWDLPILRDTWVPLGQLVDIHTGIAVDIPIGYYGRIVSRSSTPRRRGLIVIEGIIDAGYRGELYAATYCMNTHLVNEIGGVKLNRGESIAQLIISPVPDMELEEAEELSQSERGKRGFGSSGR